MQQLQMIYLIAAEGSSLVKIGVSSDPQARLKNLMIGSPVKLRLLWTAPGDRSLEAALHRRLSERQSHGEWFDLGEAPVEKLQAEVALLRQHASKEAGLPGALVQRTYRLRDPRTGRIRHIGKSTHPERATRLHAHSNPEVRAWLVELREAGLKANVEVLGGETTYQIRQHLLAGEPLIGWPDPEAYRREHRERMAGLSDLVRRNVTHLEGPEAT